MAPIAGLLIINYSITWSHKRRARAPYKAKPHSVHYILSSSLPTLNPHRSVHSGMSRGIYFNLLYRITRITEANKKILE